MKKYDRYSDDYYEDEEDIYDDYKEYRNKKKKKIDRKLRLREKESFLDSEWDND